MRACRRQLEHGGRSSQRGSKHAKRDSGTTVVNGFIVNKKSVLALDNLGQETVRTSGLGDLNLEESIITEEFQSNDFTDTTEIPEESVTFVDDIMMMMNQTDAGNSTDYQYSDDMFNTNTTTEYEDLDLEDVDISKDTPEILVEVR